MTPEDLVALARDFKTKRDRAESRLELDLYRRKMADLVAELADALEAAEATATTWRENYSRARAHAEDHADEKHTVVMGKIAAVYLRLTAAYSALDWKEVRHSLRDLFEVFELCGVKPPEPPRNEW